MALSGLLALARKRWNEIAQAGVWGVALATPLLWAPPRLAPGVPNDTWIPIAEFAVTIVFAIIWTFLRPRVSPSLFAVAAAVLLIAGMLSTFQYTRVYSAWTCDYAGRGPVVIGAKLSDEGRSHAARIGTSGCKALIEDFIGETDELWPLAEMIDRYVALGAWYIANLMLFATAAAAALESFRSRRA